MVVLHSGSVVQSDVLYSQMCCTVVVLYCHSTVWSWCCTLPALYSDRVVHSHYCTVGVLDSHSAVQSKCYTKLESI